MRYATCQNPFRARCHTNPVLRDSHFLQEAEIYSRTLGGVAELEAQYGALWTACQRCQGSLHQDVLCTSRDCPIFYRWGRVRPGVCVSRGWRVGWRMARGLHVHQQGLPHPIPTRACDQAAIRHGVSIQLQAHVDLFASRNASHALASSRAQDGMEGSQRH